MAFSAPSRQDIRTLGKGASTALAGTFLGRGLWFLAQMLLARSLGPEGFGLFALGWTTLQLAAMWTPLGLHHSVLHEAARYWPHTLDNLRKAVGQHLRLSLFFGGVAGLVGLGTASWMANTLFHNPALTPVLRGMAVALVAATVLRVAATATRLAHTTRYSALTEDLTVYGVLFLAAVIGKGMGRLSVDGMVLAVVFAYGLAALLAMVYLHRMFGWHPADLAARWKPTSALLRFSLTAALGGMFTATIMRMDRLLIGHFLSAEAVGLYQVAAQIAMLAALMLQGFNAIFSPMIAHLYHTGQHARLAAVYRVSTKWGLYVVLPLFLVALVAAEDVLTVLFGPAYRMAARPLQILLLGQLVNVGTGAVGLMLILTGNPRDWMGIAVSALVLHLVLGIWAIPRYGLNAAAWAAALATAWLFGMALWRVRQRLGFWPYDRRYLKGLLGAGVAAGLLGIWHAFRPAASFLDLLGMTAIAVGLFAGLVLFWPDDEEQMLLEALRQRWNR